MEGDQKLKQRNIVVTGFGLFATHQLNPSWEAIKDGRLKVNRDVVVVTRQVPVAYQEVDAAVAELWSQYDPLLMVHIGLAHDTKSIKVEQMARHGPYLADDVVSFAPHKHLRSNDNKGQQQQQQQQEPAKLRNRNYSCLPCSFGFDETCLDVDLVCRKMTRAYNEGTVKIPTTKSIEAGLFLCEYIYYKSLQRSARTVFVHVPNIDTFSLDDITANLKLLIELLIDEIDKGDSGRESNALEATPISDNVT